MAQLRCDANHVFQGHIGMPCPKCGSMNVTVIKSNKKKKNKTAIMLFIGSAVLAIVAITFFLVTFFNRTSKEGDEGTVSTATDSNGFASIKKTSESSKTEEITETQATDEKASENVQSSGSGWYESGDYRYYYGEDGKYVTGWEEIEGKWYFFNPKGIMLTGWRNIKDYRYYLDKNGAMVTGWQEIEGFIYHFGTDGDLSMSQYIEGYWLDGSGVRGDDQWTWRENGKGAYYINQNDVWLESVTVTIDGKECTFNENGYLVK